METSVFLAKVLGLFGAISTLAVIIRYKFYLSMEADAAKSPSSLYLSGFIFLILGVLMVITHSVWVTDWRIIITILGWLLLIKGIMRIFFTEYILKMIEKKQSDKRFLLAEIATFCISLFLIYKGFS